MYFEAKIDGLDELIRQLDGDLLYKTQKRTTTEIGRAFRTKVIKDVRKRYNIKAKDLKSKMSSRFVATSRGFEWRMVVRSKRLSVSHFSPKKNKRGVSLLVRRDRGRRTIKNAFIAKGQVFMRKGKDRLPIKALKTLSAPQMFRDEIVESALEKAKADYPKKFRHNLAYYMGKIK